MKKMVREKATAIIQAQKIEVPATQSMLGAALQGKLSEPFWNPLPPTRSRIKV
jgi:hypothetical protein